MKLMFFKPNWKSCEVKKKCKIEKHMELGLYHKPIINFQGVQIEGVKSVKLCQNFNI